MALKFNRVAPPKPLYLTKREAAVCRLLAKGLNRKEVAFSLKLSVKTVYTYIQRAAKKFGIPPNSNVLLVKASIYNHIVTVKDFKSLD